MGTALLIEANLLASSEAMYQRWLRKKGIPERDRRLSDLDTKKLQPAGWAHEAARIYEDFLARGQRKRIDFYKRRARAESRPEMFVSPWIETFRQLILETVENVSKGLHERISTRLRSMGDLSPALSAALLDYQLSDQFRSRILDIVNAELGVLEAEGQLKVERDTGDVGNLTHQTRAAFLAPFQAKRSRNAIAESACVTPSSLQRWHQGKSRLSAENVAKLAEHLKVDPLKIPNK